MNIRDPFDLRPAFRRLTPILLVGSLASAGSALAAPPTAYHCQTGDAGGNGPQAVLRLDSSVAAPAMSRSALTVSYSRHLGQGYAVGERTRTIQVAGTKFRQRTFDLGHQNRFEFMEPVARRRRVSPYARLVHAGKTTELSCF